MAVSVPLVEADIRRRADTDRQISFSNVVAAWIVLAILTFGIGAAVYAYVIFYRLVDRRNQHFGRQQSLYRNVVRVLREHAEDRNDDRLLATVGRTEGVLNDVVVAEGDRNPWLWAIILPIVTFGIASYYMLWFLMTDYREHYLRQRELVDLLSEGLRLATGKNVAIADESLVPDRNFWIYLLLTIVTFGLFGIYWLYTLLEDPNKHFARQAFAEDQMVAYVRMVG